MDEPRKCSDLWKCLFITFDWTFKYTGSVGSRLRDPDTINANILPEADPELTDDELISFVDESYNGVDHEFVSNYYTRFLFDNAINIILVMILLNML